MKNWDQIKHLLGIAELHLAAFLKWWLSELAWFVPQKIRSKLIHSKAITLIEVSKEVITVNQAQNSQVRQVKQIAREEIDKAEETTLADCAPAYVGMAQDRVFIDRFKVPEAVRAKLRQALSFEVSRRSPFPTQEILFDYCIVEHNAAEKWLNVECAIAPASLVQDARDVAKKLGYFPVELGLSTTTRELSYVFSRQRLPWSFHRPEPALAAIMVSLLFFCSAIGFSIWHHSQTAEKILHQAEALKADAQNAQKVKNQAEKTLAALSLVKQRAAETKVVDVLLGVTDALPDDTWVSSLELNGNELKLTGNSSSAASLIEKLTAASVLDRPHFRAAITPQFVAQDKNAERFEIAATVRNRSNGKGEKWQ